MSQKRITVIGSMNMDLVISSPKPPVLGETVLGDGFMTNPGGKGANQAVAVARLKAADLSTGNLVSMVGCVGRDAFGAQLLENLNANGVDTRFVTTVDGVPTGVAVIVLYKGDNTIIVDPGANHSVTPEMLDAPELIEQIRQSDVLLIQLEIPFETVVKAIDIAKSFGVKVILNPAPAPSRVDVASLLSKVDVLTPNESECEAITGLPIKNVADAMLAATHLLQKGVPQVVITLGGSGVVYNEGPAIVHKPALPAVVVDTTAAGDSFSGALAVALADGSKGGSDNGAALGGSDIGTAIDFALKVGAITVSRAGAQVSLPYLDEV